MMYSPDQGIVAGCCVWITTGEGLFINGLVHTARTVGSSHYRNWDGKHFMYVYGGPHDGIWNTNYGPYAGIFIQCWIGDTAIGVSSPYRHGCSEHEPIFWTGGLPQHATASGLFRWEDSQFDFHDSLAGSNLTIMTVLTHGNVFC